jgi:hypothetical protein
MRKIILKNMASKKYNATSGQQNIPLNSTAQNISFRKPENDTPAQVQQNFKKIQTTETLPVIEVNKDTIQHYFCGKTPRTHRF